MTKTKAKSTTKAARTEIVTVMRVKDEGKYIGYALRSLAALGGEVVVLDDGSTDDTAAICRSFDFVRYHWQLGMEMDEGRDRTYLYQEALNLKPKWIFTLDGDEVLDPHTPERMLRAVKGCPEEVNVFWMWLAVMASDIDAGKDKWFGPPEPFGSWTMPRLFRVRDAKTDYEFTGVGPGNLHCGCVPELRNANEQKLNAWIKYYGYESDEARQKKHDFYETHDPVHFKNTLALWENRKRYIPTGWKDGADCREMGKHGTVIY